MRVCDTFTQIVHWQRHPNKNNEHQKEFYAEHFRNSHPKKTKTRHLLNDTYRKEQ
jgi:hypothetical protein